MSAICVFGDSITWGAYDLELGGWVNRLKLHFDQKGDYQTEVYNLGISGDKVLDVLKHFETEAKARIPDQIIFAMGINDSPHESHPNGTKLADFEKQFKQLLSKARKFTQDILILGLTNVDESRREHSYQNDFIEKYNQKIKQIAQNQDLPFVDLFSTLSIDDFADGLHPNAHGHQKIFEQVKEALSI